MKKAEISKLIKEMDPKLKRTEDAFKVATILIAASVGEVGHKTSDLAKFTGYSETFIKQVSNRLKRNGIWKNGKTYCEWADKKTGVVAFWLDVTVGLGWVNKVPAKKAS